VESSGDEVKNKPLGTCRTNIHTVGPNMKPFPHKQAADCVGWAALPESGEGTPDTEHGMTSQELGQQFQKFFKPAPPESGAGTLRERAHQFWHDAPAGQHEVDTLVDFARSERNAALRRCAEIVEGYPVLKAAIEREMEHE